MAISFHSEWSFGHFVLNVCSRPGKWTVMYLCFRSICICLSPRILPHDFGTVLTVWYFVTWFRNCSDSLINFYMISELFWQCDIFQQDFGTVLTVWYFPIWFLNCSDSVVFFYMISELLWQCCIFLHVSVQGKESELSCISVLALSVFILVLGFYCMISELFWQCGIFLHNFWTVLSVWYFST
jgi:hypothetical protein